MLIEWTGWVYQAEAVLGPVMRTLNLPSEAALPLLSGMLINIYAAIAVMTVLPFSLGQMTLIAVFSLIAHNLIVEGIIQHRSGINATKITLIRVAAAVVTVLVISPFLGDTSQSVAAVAQQAVDVPFLEALRVWGLDTLWLLLKIFLIIMFILMALEVLSALGWTRYLDAAARPLMRLLGLPGRSAMLWVTAVVFGLMYGGAVIQEEARRGELSKTEMERLHVSIGINHSMVEDPALFLALGLHGFWIWVPKLVAAAVAVHVLRLLDLLGDRTWRRGMTRQAG
jgi:hypothetical protein